MKPKTKKCYYYYGNQDYTPKELAVYIVWCEPTDNKKFNPIVIPVLAPQCDDIEHPKGNSSSRPGKPDDRFYFPTLHYIKAAAKKVATNNIYVDVNNPKSWRPEAYKFCSVCMQLNSLQYCIDDERGKHVWPMLQGNYTFRDMAGDYVMDGGTVPITYNELMDIANEEEEFVGDLASRILDCIPPSDGKLH